MNANETKKYRTWFSRQWRNVCNQLKKSSIDWNHVPITPSPTLRNPPERSEILGTVGTDEEDCW